MFPNAKGGRQSGGWGERGVERESARAKERETERGGREGGGREKGGILRASGSDSECLSEGI